MKIDEQIAEFDADMRGWRQHLHAHPETAFEEFETAEYVAARLTEFGVPFDRGLAGTGIVATIKGREEGDGAIALRADMDALNIEEQTNLTYRSRNEGKMHACGHDGHTAMLLGAAKRLSQDPDFAGTVHLIFQPAEEAGGGGRVMIEEGLFDKYPADAVYGMHNWPGLPVGEFAVRPGPILAASDFFEIKIEGKAAHAAMPQKGVDSIVAAAQTVSALQSVTSRTIDPMDSAVVSITWIKGGDTWNIIPRETTIGGTIRFFREEMSAEIEASVRRLTEGTCAAYGATAHIHYDHSYPPTVNSATETEIAAQAAASTVGDDRVDRDVAPSLPSEDFGFMLQKKPGCYILIGNGPDDHGRRLHSPAYDFNDDILSIGASYWINLVGDVLGSRRP